MANIRSQIKRNRQNEVRRQRNRSIRSGLKSSATRAVRAAESGEVDEARLLLREAQSRIDVAVSKGVLHKRTAARRKSRLSARIESLVG